jgi:hypothetical protein
LKRKRKRKEILFLKRVAPSLLAQQHRLAQPAPACPLAHAMLARPPPYARHRVVVIHWWRGAVADRPTTPSRPLSECLCSPPTPFLALLPPLRRATARHRSTTGAIAAGAMSSTTTVLPASLLRARVRSPPTKQVKAAGPLLLSAWVHRW